MNEEKKLPNNKQHVYGDLFLSLRSGKYRIAMEGVLQRVHVSPKSIRVTLPSSPGCEIQFKRNSVSLYRDPKEYAATILETLDPGFGRFMSPGDRAAVLQNMVEVEESLNRCLPPHLFKTLFKTIGTLSKHKSHFVIRQKNSCVLWSAIDFSKKGSKYEDFLSINLQETDKEILGRLLCRVYLSDEYTKQKAWKNLQEERT
uniref:Uncharacterized protein n=1 Tax=Leptospirillum ferrodiazotrophum TaxID=412449 RepID=C6I167_9BACT|nr:MAG: hypothetical protein UBAL3_96780007 [Leptospirillum ferrodiazotrophum]